MRKNMHGDASGAQNHWEESSMKTDSMRVLADEELDYIAGGLSVTDSSVSLTDTSVSTNGTSTDVDLGGAYASTGSTQILYAHTDAGLTL